MGYLFIYIAVPIIAALLHLSLEKRPLKKGRSLEIWIGHLLFWGVGLPAIFAFLANTCGFIEDWIANVYGWEQSKYFQNAWGISMLGLGVLGVGSVLFKGGWWLSTTLLAVITGIGTTWLLFLGNASWIVLSFAIVYGLVGSALLLLLAALYWMTMGPQICSCITAWYKGKRAKRK